MSVEVCPPIMRLAAQQPFRHRIGQQTEEIAMGSAHQNVNRFRQVKVLPFSVVGRNHLGNPG